jgi:predicted DNA-binding transcriptional regulator YafY
MAFLNLKEVLSLKPYHVTIEVILNYELEREIVGFGECITVIKPKKLRERIEAKLRKAVEKYQTGT